MPRRTTCPRGTSGKTRSSALTSKRRRAFVVVGGTWRVVGYLKEANFAVEAFEGVEPDPSVETVMEGAEAMKRFQSDHRSTRPKRCGHSTSIHSTSFQQLTIPFSFPKLQMKAHFCAIPSTSVTATKETEYPTSDENPLADFNITPDVVIVDPSLVETIPSRTQPKPTFHPQLRSH